MKGFVLITLILAGSADASKIERVARIPPEIEGYVRALSANDADALWRIVQKFENRPVANLKELQERLNARRSPEWIKVRIGGGFEFFQAAILGEDVERIACRVEGIPRSGMEMYDCSAWIMRHFKPLDAEFSAYRIDRQIVVKMYVTVDHGKYVRYYNDEIQLETVVIPPK